MSSALASGHAGATGTVPGTNNTRILWRLYAVRFVFAFAWAALMLAIADPINPAVVALLVIYPLFDAAAAVVDFRSSGDGRPKVALLLNMGLSVLTAAGVAFAATSGIPAVLQVWGVWAVAAGIVQLSVAILRYPLGGQWAMILSGGISVLAGSGFILMAGGPNASLTAVAGYAILGGVFFLVSAVRLRRLATKTR